MKPSTVTTAKKRGNCRVGKSGRATSVLQGVDNDTWWVGHIQKKQRRAGGSSQGSLKQRVDLANREVPTGRKTNPITSTEIVLQYYTRALGQ